MSGGGGVTSDPEMLCSTSECGPSHRTPHPGVKGPEMQETRASLTPGARPSAQPLQGPVLRRHPLHGCLGGPESWGLSGREQVLTYDRWPRGGGGQAHPVPATSSLVGSREPRPPLIRLDSETWACDTEQRDLKDPRWVTRSRWDSGNRDSSRGCAKGPRRCLMPYPRLRE